jgi:hypothetical protein
MSHVGVSLARASHLVVIGCTVDTQIGSSMSVSARRGASGRGDGERSEGECFRAEARRRQQMAHVTAPGYCIPIWDNGPRFCFAPPWSRSRIRALSTLGTIRPPIEARALSLFASRTRHAIDSAPDPVADDERALAHCARRTPPPVAQDRRRPRPATAPPRSTRVQDTARDPAAPPRPARTRAHAQ